MFSVPSPVISHSYFKFRRFCLEIDSQQSTPAIEVLLKSLRRDIVETLTYSDIARVIVVSVESDS